MALPQTTGDAPDIVPIAIVGGGLCGLALATGLARRKIPFKLYEARASFQEIGAGINVGPNTLEALRLIDDTLGARARQQCVQNPPGKEDVWMQVRLGAPTQNFKDAELITELMAPPTGNMTAHRNDLLQVLAEGVPAEASEFNKKVVSIEEHRGTGPNDDFVRVDFSDDTHIKAGAVIACDGIHSAVRKAMLDPDDPAAVPQFADSGAYRGLPDLEVLESSIGREISRTSNVLLGPGGYIILYPVDSGRKVNIGLWHWRRSGGVWPGGRDWVIPSQRDAMYKQFSSWGDTAHKIMNELGDPAFWATHSHVMHPKSFTKGRICLIGDAAHSMPPHQGAGAGQAVEDSFVMVDLLSHLQWDSLPSRARMEAAFQGFEAVRAKRSKHVADTSHEALSFWSDLYRQDLTQQDLAEWVPRANARFQQIWDARLEEQAAQAVDEMNKAYQTIEATTR